MGYLTKIKRSLGLAFGAHSAWLSHKNVPYLIIREDRNTKIWISRERKELFRWNKKHLSYFLKGYHLVRNKILIKNSRQALNFLVAIDWESFQQNLPFPVNLRSNLDSFFLIGIHSMQGWPGTTRHGVTRQRNTKRLRPIQNLFRKNLQLNYVC